MRYLNRTENPNAIVGVFLLILLAIFAGPNTLPRLLSSTVPFIDEGVPCSWLRESQNRATHQSLIGRRVSAEQDPPFSLTVRTSDVDPSLGADQLLTVSIIVSNETIGTVPILVTPDQLILEPAQPQNGFGVILGSAGTVPQVAEATTSYDEGRIHLLGPRQRCIFRTTLTLNSLAPGGASVFAGGTQQVTAFYRNSTPGAAIPNGDGPVVFDDQGLWVGTVTSPPQTVGVLGQP